MPTITFVSGDTGGARNALAITRELSLLPGWQVLNLADPAGEGRKQFQDEKLTPAEELESVVQSCDILYLATCSTAYHMAHKALSLAGPSVPVVFGVDGYFNHGFPQWRDIDSGFWLAMDKWHAASISELRPRLSAEKIVAVGNPSFDDLVRVHKEQVGIRQKTRQELGLEEGDAVLLWWSHGTKGPHLEDREMMMAGLLEVSERYRCVFIPRLHPKLDREVSPRYLAETREFIETACQDKVRIVYADEASPTELNLAADVMLTGISVEAERCIILGEPPVVHLLGPDNRELLEGLGQVHPYIPYLKAEKALVAWRKDEVGDRIVQAFTPSVRQKLRFGWLPPFGNSAKRIVEFLQGLF